MKSPDHIPFDRISASVWLAATTIGMTWRYRVYGPGAAALTAGDSEDGRIIAFWHEYLLAGFHYLRRRRVVALISASRDGERLSAVLQRWGYDLVRGSSSRKGFSSLRQSVRMLRDGRQLAITPDGPRGPRRVLKPGVAQIARAANAAVIPVAADIRPGVRLRSWDRFVVPLPFARISLHAGAPLVPRDFAADGADRDPLLDAINQGLNA
ncbi:MAG: DUF374 domain-containing protein [Chitinivibrionales bacterium]|nr:DUF374 domain-containing protein [Chitinivibrionales bacterium]